MIYCFNERIGRTNSGIEHAQVYRATMLRRIGEPFKLIYVGEYQRENIADIAGLMGVRPDELIWLYQFFTDCEISTPTYTLEDLEKTLEGRTYQFTRSKDIATYSFERKGSSLRVQLTDATSNCICYVEIREGAKAVRRDHYGSCKQYSTYYMPRENGVAPVSRRFFNKDGTTAYEEIIDPVDSTHRTYKFPDRIVDSKEELIGLMLEKLRLRKKDIVLLDRNEKYGQTVIMHAQKAKVGVAIHAEHFVESSTNSEHIKWNEFYEYAFDMQKHVDFFLTATPAQKRKLESQMMKYKQVKPVVYALPVGSLQQIHSCLNTRKPYSMITASRLAAEKRIDLLIEAAAAVHEQLPELTFDIYGKGQLQTQLQELIDRCNASSYIHLKGYANLNEIYRNYEAYVSASSGEGFGLTLMEAVGSGLSMLGFRVRYGNQTFIKDRENGYLLAYKTTMTRQERIDALSQGMLRMFTEGDMEEFHEASYAIAEEYRQEKVEKKWKRTLKRIAELPN